MKTTDWKIHSGAKILVISVTIAIIALQMAMPRTQSFSGTTGATAWSKQYSPYDNADPAIADVDNDGQIEVIIANNYDIVALTGLNGNQEWLTPLGSDVNRAPTIGDIDFDGKLEILAACGNGTLFCLRGNGTIKWQLSVSTSRLDTSPTIGDVDGDEQIEILLGCDDNKVYCIDGKTRATEWMFTADEQVRVKVSIGDVDLDGIPEVVFASKTNSGTNGKVYCLYGNNGTLRWSKTTTFAFEGSAVIANVQGDAKLEVISGSGAPLVCYAGTNGSTIWSYNSGVIANNQFAVADANNDGFLDAVFVGQGRVFSLYGKNGTLNWTRNLAPGFSMFSCPAVGDVDGDGKYEVAVGGTSSGGNYGIYFLNGKNGSTVWRGFQNGAFNINPVIADVDQDGKTEIFVYGHPYLASYNYVYCLIGNGAKLAIDGSWYMDGRNERHEGNYLRNLNLPTVNGTATPGSGSQLTMFNFTVTYKDLDNNFPYHVGVVINGTYHAMTKINAGDKNYVDGTNYKYQTTLPLGTNNYYFTCSDGYYTNVTGTNSVVVSIYNPNLPTLTSPQVSPTIGYNRSTLFRFSVIYTDIDNNSPTFVQIQINSSIYSMTKLNASDGNFVDGCIYKYDSYLPIVGNYSYQMSCSDGNGTVSTSILSGPEVRTIYLRNYIRITNSTYEWIDATSGSRANMPLQDSKNELYSLPFEFKFYNGTFTTMYVSVNGFVSFQNHTLNDNIAFPSLAYPFIIAPYMDNLETTTPCNIFVRNLTSPNGVVVSWNNISTSAGRLVGSFQVVILETGEIHFNYRQMYYTEVYECGLNYGKNSAYYSRYTNVNSYIANFSLRYIYEANIFPPTLTSPSMTPTGGDQTILRTFTVRYTDGDGNAPLYIRLSVNGTKYQMHKVNPADTTYSDGCDYHVDVYLQPGLNSYQFEAMDLLTPISTSINSTIITGTNGSPPSLLNAVVNRLTGWASASKFVFMVKYTDADNNAPVNMNLLLNNTIYVMSKLDANDTNYVDGCIYMRSMVVLEGKYAVQFNCTDGINPTSLNPGITITVLANPMHNYYMRPNTTYSWENMSGAIGLSMHDGTEGCEKVMLPFPFKFYNNEYTHIWVGLNGFISFETTPTWAYSGTPMLFPAVSPKLSIAPFWMDLSRGHPCSISFKAFSSPSRFVIEWQDMDAGAGPLAGSFQLVLYESGYFVFNYDYLDYTTDYSTGINHGINLAYYNQFAALNTSIDNYSILFTYDLPTSSSPGDRIVAQNATVAPVTWRLHAENGPGTYRILRNGTTIVNWQAWPGNDVDVSVQINTSTGIGRWIYQIEFIDALGIPGVADAVNVDVNDAPRVVLSIKSAPNAMENSTGVYIQWTISDSIGGSGTYRVLVNNSLYQDWTSWTSGLPFTMNVNTNMGIGSFNYTLLFVDVHGLAGKQNVTLISIIDRPHASHPADFIAREDGISSITWTLTDSVGPGVYRALRNGVPLSGWLPWLNSTPVIIPVNTTIGLGNWNYTICFNNSRGAMGIQDEVMVTVDDLPSGFLQAAPGVCLQNATGVNISWRIVDGIGPGNYSVNTLLKCSKYTFL